MIFIFNQLYTHYMEINHKFIISTIALNILLL